MSFYVDPHIRPRFDALPAGAKRKLMEQGVHLENAMDLNRAVQDAFPGADALAGIFPAVSDVVSYTECTGLIPSSPLHGEAYSSYKELSPMELPDDADDLPQR